MITYIGMFIEGLLSFLSPCVLPLVPLFMSYLSSDAKTIDENGNITYNRWKVFFTTLSFTLGMSIIFFILALSVNKLAPYIGSYTNIIGLIGGVIIIFFGLHQTGLITISFLNAEAKLKINMKLDAMNYFKAFIFGFLFTFGWTPCVGPMLASALTLAASAESNGYIYLIVYALGFILPFILTGIFTTFILNFIKKHNNILSYIIKIAGVIMILFGIYSIYNSSKNIIALQNSVATKTSESTDDKFYLNEYEYKDVDGNIINLRDYEGKFIYLDFIATWCEYCKEEIPYFHEFSTSHDDIACFYVMSPSVNGSTVDEIKEFIKENDIKIQIIVDEEGVLFNNLNVQSFPSLFIMAPDQSVIGYSAGLKTTDGWEEIYNKSQEVYYQK